MSSLKRRMFSTVRNSNAFPSPPPFGRSSSSESTDGMRSRPTVARKWSANDEPRCGEEIVVTESTSNGRSVMCVVRYLQSIPPYGAVSTGNASV